MSEGTFWTSKSLVRQKKVILKDSTPFFLFFNVKDYSVKHDKMKDTWGCTCAHGSIWGVGMDCSHIEACKRWLKGEDL